LVKIQEYQSKMFEEYCKNEVMMEEIERNLFTESIYGDPNEDVEIIEEKKEEKKEEQKEEYA